MFPGLVAGLRPAGLRQHAGTALGVLPGDDADGRGQPVCARVVDPVGHPRGDCLGGAAWRAVPRRGGDREAGRHQRGGARQDRHPHDRRAGGRGLREFSAGARDRDHGAGLCAGGEVAAPAGARHRARREGAGRAGTAARGLPEHRRAGCPRELQRRAGPAGTTRAAGIRPAGRLGQQAAAGFGGTLRGVDRGSRLDRPGPAARPDPRSSPRLCSPS
jgi:hypothetical protein